MNIKQWRYDDCDDAVEPHLLNTILGKVLSYVVEKHGQIGWDKGLNNYFLTLWSDTVNVIVNDLLI